MQKDGWIIRLRRSDEAQRLEYKSPINASNTSWEEFGITIDSLAAAATILTKIGLTSGLVIDRQRTICKVQNGTLTLDEVRFLGRFLEIETDGDTRDLQVMVRHLGNIEVLQNLSFDAPPYGQLLRQRRMNDQRIVKYEHDALLALMQNGTLPEWHLEA